MDVVFALFALLSIFWLAAAMPVHDGAEPSFPSWRSSTRERMSERKRTRSATREAGIE